MQPQPLALSAYPLYEYRLILRPPQAVRDRLDSIRSVLKNDYQVASSQFGFNHILLASFKQYSPAEDKLTRRLRHIFSALAPFKVNLQSFKSLPTHTIYVELPSVTPVVNMIRELRHHQSLLRVPQQDPFIASLPKVVVAQKLSPRQYETIWPMLERKHFKASFIAEDMMLLRRRTSEKNWQILERLPFDNMPVLASQGVLF
jgi:2'-5' RNA ligase